MELLQLKYFMTAARLQSITRAAETLHVAQPSISQAITRLEKELDVNLFDRLGKKVHLNANGRLFLNAVESIFGQLDKAVSELEISKSTGDHPLTLSIWKSSSLCSKLLNAFLDSHPYVSLNVIQGEAQADCDLLLSVSSYNQPPPSPSEVIFQEEILLCLHKDHPLAQHDSIPLEMARDENFIMLAEGSPFRSLATDLCKLAGFSPTVMFESDNSETMFRMLQLGQAIGFVPQYTWGSAEERGFKTLRIESPICIRTISISWHKGRKLTPSAQLFREFAKQFMKDNFQKKP